ncbi:aldehyde-activating protein [Methylopila jiangsuensis]|uniref:Aldehyde-activating protein n=1 Tax=Methylopila jiangsuensis TaxID=586230 RepID=A0A9W6N2S4_9HYPH|nr:GFA family protein [Methylopila jiangsuensis]MDR6284214.1 hypothetical protein [Methylopila jiangsuensis]GLK76269.1 aldehyde-activating protein [Methylopila jiangsuensis]
MAAGERISGRCLCGEATFEAVLEDGAMHACHCDSCRRWTGGVYLYLPVEPASLSVSGGGARFFQSSAFAERGFCAQCGSTLAFRHLDGRSADVSAQAVEDCGRFPFASEVFVDEQPANYVFAGARARLTGAQSQGLIGAAPTAEAAHV